MLLDLVLGGFIDFAAYWTGKPVVRLLSLGRLHVSFTANPDEQRKGKKRHNALTFTHDGKRYLDGEAVALVGMLTWAAIIALVIWASRHL